MSFHMMKYAYLDKIGDQISGFKDIILSAKSYSRIFTDILSKMENVQVDGESVDINTNSFPFGQVSTFANDGKFLHTYNRPDEDLDGVA